MFRRLLPAVLLILAGVSGPGRPPAAAATETPAVRFEVDTPGARAVAEECAALWRTEGPRLAARLLPRGTSVDTVTCLVLGTDAFRRTFGDAAPDWGVGLALGHGRLVAIDHARLPAVGRGVREVFLHEMVHALLFQGARGAILPTWFHEGTAMHLAGEWRFVDTVSLVLDGRVPDLATLQGPFPGSAHRADRAYRTSLLAVERLLKRHGDDVLVGLVGESAVRGQFAPAFQAVAGESDTAFAAEFAGAMRLRFGWAVLMTRWPGLFVLLAVAFLVGGARKLVLARRRLAAMEDPDFRRDEPPTSSH